MIKKTQLWNIEIRNGSIVKSVPERNLPYPIAVVKKKQLISKGISPNNICFVRAF